MGGREDFLQADEVLLGTLQAIVFPKMLSPASNRLVGAAMPSSVIAAMHYDDAAHALTIVYRGKRGTYRYYNVAPEEYSEFRSAPSKGTYLNKIFKARQHPYERVRPSN